MYRILQLISHWWLSMSDFLATRNFEIEILVYVFHGVFFSKLNSIESTKSLEFVIIFIFQITKKYSFYKFYRSDSEDSMEINSEKLHSADKKLFCLIFLTKIFFTTGSDEPEKAVAFLARINTGITAITDSWHVQEELVPSAQNWLQCDFSSADNLEVKQKQLQCDFSSADNLWKK